MQQKHSASGDNIRRDKINNNQVPYIVPKVLTPSLGTQENFIG